MLRIASLFLVSLTAIASAQAPDAPPPAAPGAVPTAEPATPGVAATPHERMFGLGYKAGNGIGFLGADLVIDPIPHLGVDLQAAFMPVSTNTGETSNIYAVAPALDYYLFAGDRSTPYISAGVVYASLKLGGASASALGTFANVGYEWKWPFGLGVQLGGGVGYIAKAEATDGTTMVSIGGKLNPNLEIGLRYMFF
jgi:hypothetical protein